MLVTPPFSLSARGKPPSPESGGGGRCAVGVWRCTQTRTSGSRMCLCSKRTRIDSCDEYARRGRKDYCSQDETCGASRGNIDSAVVCSAFIDYLGLRSVKIDRRGGAFDLVWSEGKSRASFRGVAKCCVARFCELIDICEVLCFHTSNSSLIDSMLIILFICSRQLPPFFRWLTIHDREQQHRWELAASAFARWVHGSRWNISSD
jgi:hypothetical protein